MVPADGDRVKFVLLFKNSSVGIKGLIPKGPVR